MGLKWRGDQYLELMLQEIFFFFFKSYQINVWDAPWDSCDPETPALETSTFQAFKMWCLAKPLWKQRLQFPSCITRAPLRPAPLTWLRIA